MNIVERQRPLRFGGCAGGGAKKRDQAGNNCGSSRCSLASVQALSPQLPGACRVATMLALRLTGYFVPHVGDFPQLI
jgi:hypothetical protein